MFCTNCGAEANDNAVICVKCGSQLKGHKNYCGNCGSATNPEAVVCVKCGSALGGSSDSGDTNRGIITLVLAILVGSLGIHRFYTGKTGTGIAMLALTLFGWWSIVPFIWQIIDIIWICTGKFTDKDGSVLKVF